mgnify:CR=1 FL=1
MNLRKLAQGRDCQVRLQTVCNFNPETTVLAHYRLHGLSGMGMKSPDLFGAWACSDCHDCIDGRKRSVFSPSEIAQAHLEGVIRTQHALILEGVIKL